MQHENFIVITGGPGSGKTTLIAALAAKGYARTVEAGRSIIQDQVTIGGSGLPWADRRLFAELMLSRDMVSYHAACEHTGLVFFDRGILDVVGYMRLCGLTVPAHMEKAAQYFRYHRRVFIAPAWPDIFAQDEQRKQDFAEAVRTCKLMRETYASYGYELLELPCVPIDERVRFVLTTLGEQT